MSKKHTKSCPFSLRNITKSICALYTSILSLRSVKKLTQNNNMPFPYLTVDVTNGSFHSAYNLDLITFISLKHHYITSNYPTE